MVPMRYASQTVGYSWDRKIVDIVTMPVYLATNYFWFELRSSFWIRHCLEMAFA